jgi:YesN/AraC family two-component response regulator
MNHFALDSIRNFPLYIDNLESANSDIFNAPDCIQIVFLLTGSLQLREKLSITIKPNSLVIIPKNHLVQVIESKEIQAVQLIFSQDFIKQIRIRLLNDEVLQRLNFFEPDSLLLIQSESQVFSKIESVLHKMFLEFKSKNWNYESLLFSLFIELSIILSRSIVPLERIIEARSSPWDIKKIINHIHAHFDQELSLQEICELCGLNPTYLSRKFKEATGLSLFEYINRIRIERACRLLKQSQKTVLEISYQVGYNNISFFNRYFRKTMHMSPREYRKSIIK